MSPKGSKELIVKDKEKMRFLPDFLIVGAMRCGTTSIYRYIGIHPSIYMPSLKEPQFFSYLGEEFSPHPASIRAIPWRLKDYCRLFGSAQPGQIIGEASTSYLYRFPETIANIRAIYGDKAIQIKIIGVLRNPVDRAWSIYMLRRQGGDWTRDFLSMAKEFKKSGTRFQYYNFIESGMYHKQVRAFQEAFPETKFFLFEELKADAKRVVMECLEFLGVRPGSIPSVVGKIFNFSGVPASKGVYPIYHLLFHRSKIKDALKPLMPDPLRSLIKFRVGRMVSKKERMPDEARIYLQETFSTDIQKLAGRMETEEQRMIVESWLQ